VITRYSPVVRSNHEVEEEADGLLHADLVSRRKALVQLIVDRRDDSFKARHTHLCGMVQCIKAIISEGFNHVPDINEMN
jgi:hypothetical protein